MRRKQEPGHLLSRLVGHDAITRERVDHLNETTIGLFLERRLSDEHVHALEHHIDSCSECRRLVAELARTSLSRVDRIGRYVVLDLVGSGAMGSVYAAFDPDLDRKVALKLLRAGADAGEAEKARLLREAQALARVSHAGVVAVHDVGTVGDQIFIAMEFVAGGTLKTWIRERHRSWRAILGVGVAVGRGLAAVHAVGLVHRDVKPDNILIDLHGVARIGDFGLAERVGEPSELATAIAGTPAYMAPEQLAGEPATTRSDQFSFCATLYEALYGVRPYPGTTVEELTAVMAAERLAPAASERGIPNRVRAAIVRGLARDPSARYASMDALLATLSVDRWSRQRLAAVTGASVVAIGLTGFGIVHASAPSAPCTTAAAEIAPVWNAERRARVHDAIVATRLPFAADTASRVDRALDAYVSGWTVMHRETCEATAVHRTQSSDLLDRRMTCLDHRRLDLDAAITTLSATNRDSVRHAIEVTSKLPALAACSDPSRLGALAPAPTDPVGIAELESIQRELARARVLDHAAAPLEAVAVARGAAERAERIGYAPVVAAAYLTLGNAQLALAQPTATRESFEHAITAATAGGDEETEARALANLAMLLRHDSPDGAVATADARHAMAIVERSHRDPLLEAAIRYANIEVLAGIDQPAVSMHLARGRERLAAAAAAGADTRELQLAYEQVEAFLEISADSALEKLALALRTAEGLYGPTHPQVAAVLVNMAGYAMLAGRPDEARSYAKRVAEILAPYPGSEIELRRIEADLEQDPVKKRPLLEAVVKMSEALYGPHSPQLASDRELLAENLLELEQYRDGLVQIDATIAIWESAYGGHYEKMITSLTTKAQLLAGIEDWDGVAAAAERANAIVDHSGMREVTRAMAKLLLVDVYFRQHRFGLSLSTLEALMPLLKIVMAGDPQGAVVDFYAAACKWELGRNRAVELRNARAAYATFRTAEKPDKGSLEFMSKWLVGK